MKLVLGWYGGKFYMVDKLLALFPPHRVYVEPFGGGAAVLLNKPPAPLEVYNDVNQHLVNFFRVLRDDAKRARLIERLRLTPYSRVEHRWACQHYRDTHLDDVERAALFFTATYQSINVITGNAWKNCDPTQLRKHIHPARQWSRRVEQLGMVAERLRNVLVECCDFELVFRRFDSPETLFYIDPPYLHTTRKAKAVYEWEMCYEDHVRLLHTLQHLRGKALVSGYSNELYDNHLRHWYTRDFPLFCRAASVNANRAGRIERVWMNYQPIDMNQLGLVDTDGVSDGSQCS